MATNFIFKVLENLFTSFSQFCTSLMTDKAFRSKFKPSKSRYTLSQLSHETFLIQLVVTLKITSNPTLDFRLQGLALDLKMDQTFL